MMASARCEGILPDGRACPNEAIHDVRVSTTSGSLEGKLITIRLCQECYDVGGWLVADRSGSPWDLARREIDA
jgi:hypothetical protein